MKLYICTSFVWCSFALARAQREVMYLGNVKCIHSWDYNGCLYSQAVNGDCDAYLNLGFFLAVLGKRWSWGENWGEVSRIHTRWIFNSSGGWYKLLFEGEVAYRLLYYVGENVAFERVGCPLLKWCSTLNVLFFFFFKNKNIAFMSRAWITREQECHVRDHWSCLLREKMRMCMF